MKTSTFYDDNALEGWKLISHIKALVHCKYMNARFECNDIVIPDYSHYPFDQNAKSSDNKCFTLSIKCFCILIKRVMTVYGNYDVIAFKSCIQIFTVYQKQYPNLNDYELLK